MIELIPFEKQGMRYYAYVVYQDQRIPVVMSQEDWESPDALKIVVLKIKAALDRLVEIA